MDILINLSGMVIESTGKYEYLLFVSVVLWCGMIWCYGRDRFQKPEIPKFPFYMREWNNSWYEIDDE